jgi:hypothetical protein
MSRSYEASHAASTRSWRAATTARMRGRLRLEDHLETKPCVRGGHGIETNYSVPCSLCRRAFGGFLHHTPAAALSKSDHTNDGLRRAWWQACREEHINPQQPTRLPLIFALDRKLGIQGGFVYLLDCTDSGELAKLPSTGIPIHCAGNLKPLKKRDSGSSCSGGSGCGAGGGHGCSGGSCGGGCDGGS